MSEEKPFEATQGRIERARREGDTARSGDLCAVCAFTCGGFTCWRAAGAIAESASAALRAAAHGTISIGAYAAMAQAVAAVCVAGAAGAVAASIVQDGRITMVPPQFKLNRLSPIAGLRRMLSRETAAGAGKAAFAAGAALVLIAPAVAQALAAAQSGATAASVLALIARVVPPAGASLAAVGMCFGVVDRLFARLSWRKRIRMSAAEFKEDQKQHDGDPLVRQRRRASHRLLVRGSIERLRDAAFVVANPVHVAVALAYHPPDVEVPRVLIRAVEAGAVEVRRRARALNIPIVEDRPLARALLAQTEIDGFIPASLYTDVARIVARLLPVLER